MVENIIEMKNISKSFNKTRVLNRVDFNLKKGEVHALVGGNGAGKSTLMKILTGVYDKSEGEVFVEGSKVEIDNPNDAENYGISIIFQELSLVPTLSIAENIFLNSEPKNTKTKLINNKKMIEETKKLLDNLNLEIDPRTRISDLGVGYAQMIEIAKAVSKEAKILIMDEPTAALSENETKLLFDFIEKLKEKNVSIIYISHRMEEIFKVTDRITVLRNGVKINTSNTNEITMDELIEEIVGKNLEEKFEWKPRKNKFKKEKPLLEVKNLSSKKDNLNKVDFKLYKGEILGIAGLMGSGRSELVETIFGLDEKETGEIILNGKSVNIKSAEDAMDKGIALLPEDRREEGLILDHNVKENLLLTIFENIKNNIFINEDKGKEITNKYIDKLNIVTDSIYKKVSLLSGGNQQKVVLAKWLATNPNIYLLDEPTIGVDIGAKTEIMEIIREIADSGKAVLVISSELRELMAVSDRILIMHKGEIVDDFEREDIRSEEDLQHAIQN